MDSLDFFVWAVIAIGLSEVFFRGPWTVITGFAAIQIAGFLLILTMPKKEIWFLIWVVIANDVIAYFGEKLVSSEELRNHPFPKTSPKKIAEGYLFVIIAGLIMGLGVGNLFSFSIVIQLSTLFVCLLAICGDLLDSKFKRFYGIKDFGDDFFTRKLLCGHGGVYDRFDAIFLVCIGWFIVRLLFLTMDVFS